MGRRAAPNTSVRRESGGSILRAIQFHAVLVSFIFFVLSGSPIAAQSFFTTLVTDPVVGADRGSASVIRKLDEPTQFLTFSNTGSDVSGRAVLGYGLGQPDIAIEGDQLDLALVWAGPSDDGWRELLAGGIAYRFPTGTPGMLGFVTIEAGDLIFGTPEALAISAKADRGQASVGMSREYDLKDDARAKFTGEFIARQVGAEVLGIETLDEDLRIIRLSGLYTKGIPLLFQQRLSLSVSKGLDAFGASTPGNPMGSAPGATTDFFRMAFAAEASVPLSRTWVVNAGLIGQWTDDSLPVSQKCGFQTNAYARGFDYAVVVGDRCIGSRVEAAYNFSLPDPEADRIVFTQGFAGIDGGQIENLSNPILPGQKDTWSSFSAGVRTLRGNFLGEIAVTRILDRPDVAAGQDRDRLWFRTAFQF